MDFDEYIEKNKQAIMKSANETVEELLLNIGKKSNKEAPIDTGRMRKSLTVELNNEVIAKGQATGTLQPLERKAPIKEMVEGEIFYPAVSESGFHYPLLQHEELGFFHPVGKAKFLQGPFFEYKDFYKEIYREKLNKNII